MMSGMNGRLMTRGWTKGWLLAALLLTLSLTATAQEVAPTPFFVPVRGLITNCAGEPLPGVTVRIQGDSVDTVRTTNSLGRYSANLPEGDYTVTPTPSGRYFFSPQSQITGGFGSTDFTRYPRDNRANFDGD